MDAVTIVGFLGTAASLWSAVFAYNQFKKSKDAADRAERAIERISHNRTIGDIGHVKGACATAVRIMSRYGPSSVASGLAGASYSADASSVQDFLLTAHEQQSHFPTQYKNLKESVDPLLAVLAVASTAEDAIASGGEVYQALVRFQKVVDDKMRKAQQQYA